MADPALASASITLASTTKWPALKKPFQMDGLKQLLQSALDSDMTQVAISPVALSELS
jgi:hypothetical protein